MTYTRKPETDSAPFSMPALKAYMRVDHDDEDAVIAALAQTAAEEVEAYCDLALLAQTITATTEGQWPGSVVTLPCGPLLDTHPVTVGVVEADGTFTPVTSGWWVEGGRYPRLHFTTTPGARLRITYRAGYGDGVEDLPASLIHAISDQTLRLFDRRGDEDLKPGLSATAARILARFRKVAA